jgi:hypothetical protein
MYLQYLACKNIKRHDPATHATSKQFPRNFLAPTLTMGAGSSRADAPVRPRARLSLAGCFGAGSSAAAAADGGGGRPAAAASSRAHEVVPVPSHPVA